LGEIDLCLLFILFAKFPTPLCFFIFIEYIKFVNQKVDGNFISKIKPKIKQKYQKTKTLNISYQTNLEIVVV